MADRMLVMDAGKLILDGKPFEILYHNEENSKNMEFILLNL